MTYHLSEWITDRATWCLCVWLVSECNIIVLIQHEPKWLTLYNLSGIYPGSGSTWRGRVPPSAVHIRSYSCNRHTHCQLERKQDVRKDQGYVKGKWMKEPGPRLNIKAVFPGMDLHFKDKTVVRPSYLYNGNHMLVRRHLYTETDPKWGCRLTCIAIPIIKIKSNDRFISIVEAVYLETQSLYWNGPWFNKMQDIP